jgi:four helix bundle protein
MHVRKVEDLLVWQKARRLVRAVSALLESPELCRDRVLADQMNRASLSVLSNISEGWEQPTDKAFARFLHIARASAAELQAQLDVFAERYPRIRQTAIEARGIANEIVRMLSALLKHLRKSNRNRRL